jgi:Siphovirus Gp157
MTISLYKATELARLHSHIDQETGEIDFAAFDAANITLAEKQIACVAHYKNAKIEIEAVKAAIKADLERVKAQEKQLERFEDYIKASMQTTGITEIKSSDGRFSAKLSIGSTQAVEIDDGAVFDEQYLLPAKRREPSKTLLKAAIEAGNTFEGARIVNRDKLTIK